MSDEEIIADEPASDRRSIDLLLGLRAVRELLPDPIPDDAMADILDVFRWTGSSRNRQPWNLVVVTDRGDLGTLARISGGNAAHAATAGAALAIVLDGASDTEETHDDGRLSERLMLAAKAHGLGAAIGWLTTPEKQAAAKDFLGVPPERTLRTLISIGRVDEAARAARGTRPDARKPLADTVHMGHFGADDD